MKKIFYYICLALLFASCEKGNLDMLGMVYTLAEGSDERFADSEAYNYTTEPMTIRVPEESYRIYVTTDNHIDFTANNLDDFVKAYKQDAAAAPFVLALGDLINAVDHYPFMYEHLSQVWTMAPQHSAERPDTCFVTLGNHDMYYDQWKVFREYFPSSTYWFEVETPSCKDLYIALDSGSGTVGYKQKNWLTKLLRRKSQEGYRHIFLYTHTHFFKKDNSQGHTSCMALEETYELAAILAKYDVELVLQGHSHHRDITRFKGIDFLRLDAMEDHYYNAFYTILTVGDTYRWEFVPVGPQKEGVEQTRIPGVKY